VSGHVDSGEDYITAAHREIKEEAGIHENLILEKIAYEKASPETEMEFVTLYKINHEGPFKFSKIEITELSWYTKQQITEMIQSNSNNFAPSFRYFWMKFSNTVK
jgi:isopentenyl-diphosphate delta-isomerase